MFVLSLLTIVVGVIALKARVDSVRKQQLSPRYFKLMQGQEVPEFVTKTTRCFNNLFEIPVLFYCVCTLYVALGIDSTFALIAAWLFVLFRAAQACIHIGYNDVIHRLTAFGLSIICVLALWVDVLVRYS